MTARSKVDRLVNYQAGRERSSDGSRGLAELIDEYIQDKRAGGATPRTTGHYREVLTRVLLPYLEAKGFDSPAQLEQRYLNEMSGGLMDGSGTRSGRPISRSTVHSYMRAINTFLVWAQEQGRGGVARGKLPPLRKRVLDTLAREEIDRLESAADNERDKLIVRLLADTGIRLGELLDLRPDDIRMERGRGLLKIRGKGERERLVPLSNQLHRRLRRHVERASLERRGDRVFHTLRLGRVSGKLDPVTKHAVEMMIRALAQKAGIDKRVYPHLFRHSFATEYLRSGGNPILLQQILGHSSLTMITQTYQHLNVTDAHAELMRILQGERE